MKQALHVEPSWQDIIEYAYEGLRPEYREFLEKNRGYFPDFDNFLNAFKTLSLDKTKYILFGQDPYPREQSAIGYAFIDGAVQKLFSQKGFSTEVNKATSLRNFMKMLLVAERRLDVEDLSQTAIARIDKTGFIDSIDELRYNFEANGVLLLNTALVFTSKEESKVHVKAFETFVDRVLECLSKKGITLILFGAMAKELKKRFDIEDFPREETLHPYNISFIHDASVQKLFQPMRLLYRD